MTSHTCPALSTPRTLLGGLLALLGAALVSPLPASAQAGGDYKLMVNDQIQLRVVEWRPELGAPQSWDALTGAYKVNAAGQISVPLVGALDASGLTPDELATRVATRVQEVVGLVAPPGTSVEVLAYNPVYVMGDVQQPGAQPFSPGLTVARAMALAGGEFRGSDAGSASQMRDATRTAGAMARAKENLARLIAREARLVAEFDGADSISYPQTLGHPGGAEAEAQIMAAETEIFVSRRDGLMRDLDALDDLLDLYGTESWALEEKSTSLESEMSLVADALGRLKDLSESGLVRGEQLLNMQRVMGDLTSQDLDLDLALYRARAQISEVKREIEAARANRLTEIALQLEDTRAQITSERRDISTNQSLLELHAIEAAELQKQEIETVLRFELFRQTDASASTEEVSRDALLLPGDVLTVRREIMGDTTLGDTAAPMPEGGALLAPASFARLLKIAPAGGEH